MIQIRRSQAQDAAAIAPIMLLAMEDIIFHFIGRSDKMEGIRFLEHFITQQANQYSHENIWVAEEDGHILGQMCLYDGGLLDELRAPILSYLKNEYHQEINVENETETGEIYLDTIAVSADAQGKGVGKALLHYAIEEFILRRQLKLGLLVDKENPSAKSLYLRTGFRVIKTKQVFGKSMEHLQYRP